MTERKEENMEENRQQENNEPGKIDLNAIYNAVRNLNADSQKTILSQYKFSELYQLFRDYEGYTKYISELIKGASAYLQTANALSELYNESLKETHGRQESELIMSMNKAYEGLSDEARKKFCESMVGKKGFFEDAYKMIIGTLSSAYGERRDILKVEET